MINLLTVTRSKDWTGLTVSLFRVSPKFLTNKMYKICIQNHDDGKEYNNQTCIGGSGSHDRVHVFENSSSFVVYTQYGYDGSYVDKSKQSTTASAWL